MATASAPVSMIQDAPRAGVLLKPMRREILAHARTPASAATIAAAMGRPRQVVNYHVRQLARAGFLRRAGRFKKRGLVEQRYVVSARAYLLAPEVLGAIDASPARLAAATDKTSAAYLLALAGQLQRELSDSWREAESAGTPLALLSLDTEFGFATPGHRARFAEALTAAITKVVADHTTAGAPRYRLVLGCYPQPTSPTSRGRR